MILPKERDPRFITIRRGGTLTDSTHHLLALWAATCAEHVLHLFEQANSDDKRPRQAIALTRAWVNGEITMRQAHQAAFASNAAGKGMPDAARFAALAAGQAVAVAHVAAHELGAAAYAIKAAMASAEEHEKAQIGRNECRWQRDQLPDEIRGLVLDDQKLRNHLCWSVFDC
ncbi:putative immunity protein [Spirosoma fluminis]